MPHPSPVDRIAAPVPATPFQPDNSLLLAALDAVPEGVILTNPRQPDNPIVYTNAGFERLTGYTAEEARGRNCRFLAGPATDPAARARIRSALAQGEGVTLELLNHRKDGTPFWQELSISPVRDDAGTLVHFIGVQKDVTDRRSAREELRRSGQRFRAMIENAPDLVGILARDGTVRYASPALDRILGWTPAETEGRPVLALVEPAQRETLRARLRAVARRRGRSEPLEVWLRHRDGSRRLLCIRTTNLLHDPSVCGIVVNAADVTEARAAEEELAVLVTRELEARAALRDSEERLRLSLEAGGMGTWDYDPATGATTADARDLELFGVAPEAFDGTPRPFQERIHPEDRALVARAWSEAITEQKPFAIEFRVRHPDGTVRWLAGRGRPVQTQDGRGVRVRGVTFDVDERRRMEAALAASERDYRGLFEQAHDPILILDPDGERVLEVNARACEVYGVPREQFVGRSMLELSTDPEASGEHVRAVLEGGDVHEFLTMQRRADGGTLVLEVRATAVDYAGRRAILSVNRDVTQRRTLEEQLRQAQKMEAVGRLAGGIAHDFNNVLMAVSGHARLLLRHAPESDPRRWSLEEIQKGAERATALTRQLLAFSRRQVLAPRVLDLNQVVAGMQGLLERLIGEDVELLFAPDAGLGHVRADRGQLEQVVLNPAVNARDAMPHGGVLQLRTGNADLTPADAHRMPYVQPGRYVRLEVVDTGEGMDAETMGRIFEPFFTTKEMGRGTGLGLATVYGIVKQSGGYVWAETAPGRGSLFTV